MIVIMGATGATGSALLQRLVALGVPSRALSRDPDRLWAGLDEAARTLVEVRAADAQDPKSLRSAFHGADQLFISMVNSPAQVALETRAITIAADSGIRHIVKLSAPAAAPDSPVAISRWHHSIEEVLRDTGLTHTLLRPYAFMQKLLTLAPAIVARDVVLGALGDAACNYVDCRDIGDVAAEALLRPQIAGQTYTLTGRRTFSQPELAERLSLVLGRRIQYVDLPPAAMRQNLVEHGGLPNWLASHIVEIQQLAVTRPEQPTDTVSRILGREPRTLEAFLSENIQHFRPGSLADRR
ncbi:NmrA family NAD(P)-binding protein [Streptomyces sp. So13.3]|nr:MULTISPECIES: NmrA family NAD(P)-binding protein [unclassified Streptomyces]MCZ4098463.1 NmrA family NAD(P)-binding protein [Streptomyces sp. H39-C1]QNA77380.1 NmrA family NAD(P)-binding protein [Streptomyces sp. So13.3]